MSSDRAWCQVCLATDVRMCALESTELKDTYEKVTGLKACEEGRPMTVCFICHCQVQRCRRLAARARAADRLLRALGQHGLEVTFETIDKLHLGKQNRYLSVLALEPLIIEMSQDKGQTETEEVKHESLFEGEVTRDKEKGNSSSQIITKVISENNITVYAERYDEETLTSEEEQAKQELIQMGESTVPETIVNTRACKLEYEQKGVSDIEEKPLVINRLEDSISFEEDILMDRVKRESITDFKEDLIDIEENILTDDIGSPSTLLGIEDELINDIKNINMTENTGIDMNTIEEIENRNATPKFEQPDYYESDFESKELLRLENERSNAKEQSLLVEKTSTNLYQCDYCEKHFHTKQGAATHLKFHTKQNRKKTFTCTICDKKVSRKSNLAMHMKIHQKISKSKVVKKPHAPNAHQTSKKKKTDLSGLEPPKRNHNKIGQVFECDQCKKTFASRNDIISHIKSHTQVVQVTLPENSIETNLNTTRRTHNDEEVLTCDDCNNKYTYRCDLIKHIRSHMNIQSRNREKPYASESHSASNSSDAVQQQYTCKTCNRIFYQHWAFVRHVKRCSWVYGPREAHKCQICREHIIFETPLINYMTFKDGQPNPYYLCKNCKHRRAKKTRGVLTNAIGTYVCDKCDESLPNKEDLEKHMKTHENHNVYPCIKCDEQLSTKSILNDHMDTHVRAKRFACKECKKTFAYEGNLKLHMNVHTGNNLYRCKKCDRTFAQRGNLSLHQESHKERLRLRIRREGSSIVLLKRPNRRV